MITLYNLASNTYANLRLTDGLNSRSAWLMHEYSFVEMITNYKLCIEFIRSVLDFDNPVSFNRDRASHIIITWLLGIGFGQHFKIHKFHNAPLNNSELLWLQTALTHDYGYFCKEVKRPGLSRSAIAGKYDLLDDKYYTNILKCLDNMRFSSAYKDYFSYTPDEIDNYYKYAMNYHLRQHNESEIADHGIVGGCMAFRKYCETLHCPPTLTEEYLRIQKIACYITASHNIFKSDSVECDIDYMKYGLNNLLSTSPKKVTKENQLLLLLSLVDTVECTKRFSKKENGGRGYLKHSTILENVVVNFMPDSVEIDFGELYNFIMKKRKSIEMAEMLKKHVNAIAGLSKWSDFVTQKINDFKVTIMLQ